MKSTNINDLPLQVTPSEVETMNTYMYGVFSNTADFSKALSALKSSGLNDVVIVKNTGNAAYSSAKLTSNLKSRFVLFGAIGAVIGGLAGAVAVPHIPYTETFQVLTPMMAMVSGAILLAYFGVWTCGFLSWVDDPILEHEVFEGNITNGAMLLGVTVGSAEQKSKAIECLDKNNAVELIVRSSAIGELETKSDATHAASDLRINAPKLVA